MCLLQCSVDGEVSLADDLAVEDTLPPYPLLSHNWEERKLKEATFQDLVNGDGNAQLGYEKIRFSGQQARCDGLQHFWIDTSCINKANKAAHSHAIQFMFRWYRNAVRCFVYLPDVTPCPSEPSEETSPPVRESTFRKSKWFTRGWTLPELLAPSTMEFSREQRKLGDKMSLLFKYNTINQVVSTVQ